jgi:mRNA interferase RelE/StbE
MSDRVDVGILRNRPKPGLDSLSPTEQNRILDKLDEIVTSPWRDPAGLR